MNKIIKLSSIIALAVAATGCSDFLDEELKSQLAPDRSEERRVGKECM